MLEDLRQIPQRDLGIDSLISTLDKTTWKGKSNGVQLTDVIVFRDGKNPQGPYLYYTIDEWDAFEAGALAREFDLDDSRRPPELVRLDNILALRPYLRRLETGASRIDSDLSRNGLTRLFGVTSLIEEKNNMQAGKLVPPVVAEGWERKTTFVDRSNFEITMTSLLPNDSQAGLVNYSFVDEEGITIEHSLANGDTRYARLVLGNGFYQIGLSSKMQGRVKSVDARFNETPDGEIISVEIGLGAKHLTTKAG